MGSVTNSFNDVAGAFVEAENPGFLGTNRVWQHENDEQRTFLRYLEILRPYVPQLKKDGLLKAMVTWNAAELNAWFAQNGSNITFEQGPDGEFYVGSIYEQMVKWKIPGVVKPLRGANGVLYPDGVHMEEGIRFYTSPHVANPVVRIETKTEGDMAYMVMLDAPPSGPFGPMKLAHDISQDLVPTWGHNELLFPMVHIDHSVDMRWLVGLWTLNDAGKRAVVRAAKQHTILKINEQGALAKSSFGMTVFTESVRVANLYTIDRPFLFFIIRNGYILPMFTAWVDYSEWKNPVSIG